MGRARHAEDAARKAWTIADALPHPPLDHDPRSDCPPRPRPSGLRARAGIEPDQEEVRPGDREGGPDRAPGAPPTFDDVTLELTKERVAKIIAGKQAGKRIAEGPNGPAAIRAKTEDLDARQAAIYKKHVNEINAWDEKRREVQNCRDSALSAIAERRRNGMMARAQSDPQYRLRLADLARAMMEAQQKGDTAATRKAQEAMKNLKAPTKADTAQAMSQCGEAGPTGLVKEWVELKSELEELQGLEQQAEVAIQQAEQSESGMTNRQLAVACERIKLFADRLKKKAKLGEFTEQEQQALQQAIKDLEELCG